MKTDIEQLLRDKKEELDIEEVPKGAWEGIRKEVALSPQKESSSFRWWKVAAVVFLGTSIGLMVYNSSLQKQVDELASLGDISEEYAEVEKSYKTQINQLTLQIPIKKVLKSEDLAWMAQELEALEEVNQQYRKDIGTDADEDLLVAALIDYYEKKIRLLRKLELELNRRQNEERTNPAFSAS